MSDPDYVEVRVRAVSATELDAIRPAARRCGFGHSISDLVRFAVELAANISRRAEQGGSQVVAAEDVQWPSRRRPAQTPAQIHNQTGDAETDNHESEEADSPFP